MKYCKACSKKGLFLNLRNEMCMDCYQELLSLESKYENLLKKIIKNTFDQPDTIASLNLLSIKLRKFSKINDAVKSEDCTNLIKKITPAPIQKKEINIEHLKANTKHSKNIINISSSSKGENSDSDLIDILNISYSAEQPDTKSLNNTSHSNSEQIELVDSKKIVDSKKLSVNTKEIKPTDNLNTIKSINSNNLLENKKIIEPLKNNSSTVNKDNKEFFIERDALKTIVKQNLYNDAKAAVQKLTSSPLTPDNLAYYTFLLKDTYVKPLRELNITEIDNYSIDKLINKNLNTLSMLVNQPHEQLYDFFNYVAFSIQTTGLNTEINHILEISAVKVRYGKIEFRFHTFVDSHQSIGLALSKKTGIYNKDLQGSPDLATAIQEFLKFAEGYKLVTHDVSYNLEFINHYNKRLNGSELHNKSESTLILYKKVLQKYGTPYPLSFDLPTCCKEMLTEKDLKEISYASTNTDLSAISIYKLYETLKYK